MMECHSAFLLPEPLFRLLGKQSERDKVIFVNEQMLERQPVSLA